MEYEAELTVVLRNIGMLPEGSQTEEAKQLAAKEAEIDKEILHVDRKKALQDETSDTAVQRQFDDSVRLYTSRTSWTSCESNRCG